MKKLFALIAVAILVLSGCSTNDDDNKDNGEDTPVIVEVGTASLTSLSGREYDADTAKEGRIQGNTYFATVALDKDGKVVYVDIDVAQNEGTFDGEGAIVKAEAIPTKTERGADYGMVGNSEIGKEWFEQMAALEEWMTGKTAAEILAMKTFEKDAGHPMVPDEEDLKSSVTVNVADYLAVFEKAVANAVEVEGVAKVGTGSYTTLKVKPAEEGVDGSIQFNVTYAGVALDKDGKILAVYIDVAQDTGKFDAEGKVLSAEGGKSKQEKKADYGMVGNSAIGKEWFEQMASFEEWMIGQTVAEVQAMETYEANESHPNVPADEDLKSSVTIDVGGYLMALEVAAANAVELTK